MVRKQPPGCNSGRRKGPGNSSEDWEADLTEALRESVKDTGRPELRAEGSPG